MVKRKPDGWAKRIPQRGELAVLDDKGPWLPGAWYWRTDLEAQQDACRKVSEGYGSALNPVCGYRPTERWVKHPVEVEIGTTIPVQGRVWVHIG